VASTRSPLEQSQQIERKFFDCADRVASCGITRDGVASVASDGQPVVLGAGTSGRRKESPGIAPNA